MKINKGVMIVIVIIIIVAVFIGGYYLKDYIDKQKKVQGINDYKKGFYDGLICEYSCPLTMQTMAYNATFNKTELLPSIDCVKGCTGPFKNKFATVSYTLAELSKDDFLKDVNDTVSKCKTSSVNMASLSLNNTAYFNCVADGIGNLKTKYSYLN